MATAKQLAWRRKFAALAKAGKLKRKAPKKRAPVARKKAAPKAKPAARRSNPARSGWGVFDGKAKRPFVVFASKPIARGYAQALADRTRRQYAIKEWPLAGGTWGV